MNKFAQLRSRGVALKTAIAASALVAASSARAELPAWATSMFTEIEGAVDSTIATIMPIAAVVIVAFVVLRVAKRGASKI